MKRVVINDIDLGELKNFRIQGDFYQAVDIGRILSNPFIGPSIVDSVKSDPENSFIDLYEDDVMILHGNHILNIEASLDEWGGELCERIFVELKDTIKAGPRPTE